MRKAGRQKPKGARTLAQGRDVAGRSRIWQALLESEDRYRATFNYAPVGIMHTSVDSDRILHANPKLSEMLGYTESELLRMTTDDILHPDHAGADRPRYRVKMLSGELDSFSSERKYVRKDNSVIWVNRTVSLARDSLGKPLYFIRIVEDITGRKQAAANLERLARARHVMAECGRALVHDSDEPTMLQEMCRVAVETGGYKMAWIGLATGDPARPVHPVAHAGFGGDAPMTASAAWSADGRYQGFMHEVITTGNPHIARNILGDPALARRRARAVQHGFQSSIALPVEGEGAILGAMAIYAREADAFDEEEIALLTELAGDIAYGIVNLRSRIAREQAEVRSRETERRFRETFEQAAVGLTRVDLNGVLVDLNQKFCDMLGYSREELLGKAIKDITHPDDYGQGSQFRAQLVHGVARSQAGEKRFMRKDGTVLWARRTMSTACDAAGRPQYVISVVEDITDRKLSALRQEMEHAVTKVISEAASVDEAMLKLLRTICEAMNWAYGARWVCHAEEGLHRAEYWSDFELEFDPEDRELWLRQGVDGSMVLLHRAWRHNEPTWVVDIEQHESFRRRASSRKLGLHSAFAFPVVAGGRVIGVMEFFGREVRQPDEMLLQVARSIGSQIGQFIQRKEAEQALRTSEERYRDVFEASPLPMWVWDDETLNIVAVNQAASDHYGYSRDEFLRMNVRDIWAPGEVAGYEQSVRTRTTRQILNLKRKHLTKDGRIIDTEVTARLFTLGGRPVWLTLVNDVSVRVRAEAALRESEEQFRQLAGNIPQVFWITDIDQRDTLYVSPAAEAMLGRPLPDILSDRRGLIRAVHKEDRARVYAARKAAVASGYDETYRILRPDGSIRWVHDRAFPVRDGEGRIYRIAGIAEDVTDRKHAEERLEHLAHYDTLTNLPNRALFYDRLKQALVQARRNRWTTGVMFIDADRFKNVNDTLGHAVGDKLLQQIAGRLTRSVRSGDTVGRLGGDEFSIVLSTLASAQDANLVAQKIMTAFNEPFKLEGTEIYVTVSIGITLSPDDSSDQDILIKNADAAMYRAKEIGRNGYQFYTPEMNARALEMLGMESSLRRALERNEFLLHYQPKASVADGDITGLEALLRWRHPERGLVSPEEFIPLLEESGLIVQVGEWVLKAVCSQIKAWERAGDRSVPVAVNLSARQFTAKDLGPAIKRILEEHQVDPALIEFEITESSLMANTEEAVRTLEYLDRLGVGLSIDDFGTGYSSLGHLKRFPLSALKIDRSFVRDVTTDGDDATITRAVISMAHSLGLKVIAEGVETRAQLEFLAEHGCNEIQGYYFAHPLAAEDCSTWIRAQHRLERPRPAADASVPVVLILDDDDDTLAHVKRILARDGYRILAAHNAREGLALLRDNSVDVVVSDQNMPGMSGVDFLQCVQTLSPGTMRLLATGHADFKTMADAVNKGGIFRCLPKDIGDDALRDNVREAVQAKLRSAPERPLPPGTLGK